jgi:hypothetical protein
VNLSVIQKCIQSGILLNKKYPWVSLKGLKIKQKMESTPCPTMTGECFYTDLKNQWKMPNVSFLPLNNGQNKFLLSSPKSVLTFRTFICELIYQATQMFPDIIEYTITCKNNVGTVILKMGTFTDPDSPVPDHLTITNGDGWCSLSKVDIIKMYVANRIPTPDHFKTNMMIDLLYSGGDEPSVKTSYTINPAMIATANKF